MHIFTQYCLYAILLILYCILGNHQYTYAQQGNSSLNTCIQDAEISFRSGNPEITIQIIEDCLSRVSQPQNSDLITAYRLLTLAYMENDQILQAETNFVQLLELNPAFDISQLPPEDADLLMLLYKSFRTDPIFFAKVEVGLNFSQVEVLQYFGAATTNTKKETYQIGQGFQTGLYFGIPLKNRNIRLMGGISFMTRSYTHADTLQTNKSGAHNFATLTNREAQSLFQIPLLINLDFDQWNTPNYKKNTCVPFIYGGVSMDYLFSSRMNEISRFNTIGASENGLSDPGIGDMRRDINYNLIVGGGIKYKIGLSYIMLDVRYTQGINNLVNPEKRYENDELLYLFGHVDDDFRLRTLSISIGVEKAFYRPQKLKR